MMLAVKQVQCLLLLRIKHVPIKTVCVSVSERLMEAHLKCVDGRPSVGSNPTTDAKFGQVAQLVVAGD